MEIGIKVGRENEWADEKEVVGPFQASTMSAPPRAGVGGGYVNLDPRDDLSIKFSWEMNKEGSGLQNRSMFKIYSVYDTMQDLSLA